MCVTSPVWLIKRGETRWHVGMARASRICGNIIVARGGMAK